MTISAVKRMFNAGELSPKCYARSDLDKWPAACKTMLNFVPLPHGGVSRRPGWEYITGAKVNGSYVRLVGFIFSNTQAYILEFTNLVMRVYMNGGQVQAGGGGAYELVTPFTGANLESLQFCQSYDTLIVTHTGYAPQKITRTAHDAWTIAAISFTAAPADWAATYPRTACFYQDRLVFASNVAFPSRIWASKTGDYFNMTTGTNDADGLVLNLLSGQADTIYWLASMKSLLAGLDTGITQITASGGSDTALTPTSKKAHKAQQYGAANIPPVSAGNNLIHAAFPATKIREIAFSWESDGYTSNEVSILSDHLWRNLTATAMAYQAQPFEIVWILRSDGALVALTYLVEHKVIGWSLHTTPNAIIKSVATIPGTYETELWAAIERTVGGSQVTYIERLKSFTYTDLTDAFFVDSGLSYSGVAIDTVTGLDHLEGCQVSYLADGIKGTATVDSNQIVIPAASTDIVVGLSYNSDLEPLTPEPDMQSGESMFKVKRITDVQFLLRESAGGTFGPDSSLQSPLLTGTLYSGKLCNLSLRGGWGESRDLFIRQNDPLPMNIDAVGYELEVE